MPDIVVIFFCLYSEVGISGAALGGSYHAMFPIILTVTDKLVVMSIVSILIIDNTRTRLGSYDYDKCKVSVGFVFHQSTVNTITNAVMICVISIAA